MKKPVFSFRLDPMVIDQATKSGIDLPRFIETSLQNALKLKKCPMCGQKVKGEK